MTLTTRAALAALTLLVCTGPALAFGPFIGGPWTPGWPPPPPPSLPGFPPPAAFSFKTWHAVHLDFEDLRKAAIVRTSDGITLADDAALTDVDDTFPITSPAGFSHNLTTMATPATALYTCPGGDSARAESASSGSVMSAIATGSRVRINFWHTPRMEDRLDNVPGPAASPLDILASARADADLMLTAPFSLNTLTGVTVEALLAVTPPLPTSWPAAGGSGSWTANWYIVKDISLNGSWDFGEPVVESGSLTNTPLLPTANPTVTTSLTAGNYVLVLTHRAHARVELAGPVCTGVPSQTSRRGLIAVRAWVEVRIP